MAAEEDGASLLCQLGNQLAHLARAGGVEAVGRLVEDDDVGVAHQGRGDAQALLHAQRVRLVLRMRALRQADQLQRLFDARVRDVAQRDRDHLEVVVAREVRVERRRLDHRADAPQRRPGVRRHVVAEAQRAPRRRPHEAEDHANGGALAGAVGSEEAEHLAGVEVDIEPADGLDLAVALAQALGTHDFFLWH